MDTLQTVGTMSLVLLNFLVMAVCLVWIVGVFVTVPLGVLIGWRKPQTTAKKVAAGLLGGVVGLCVARLFSLIALLTTSLLFISIRQTQPALQPVVPNDLALWPFGQIDLTFLSDWALPLGLLGAAISIGATAFVIIGMIKASTTLYPDRPKKLSQAGAK